MPPIIGSMSRKVHLADLRAVKTRLQGLIARMRANPSSEMPWRATYEELIHAHRTIERAIAHMELLPPDKA